MNIDWMLIKPAVKGVSDKYSWNIFRFVRKYGTRGVQVFVLDDRLIMAPKNIQCDCHPKTVNGADVRSIRSGKFKLWSIEGNANRREVTETFWPEYAEKGIAALEGIEG